MTATFLGQRDAAGHTTIVRLKMLMGLPAASSRSPFSFTPMDDLRICAADMSHSRKYFGAATPCGKASQELGVAILAQPDLSGAFTPSPMDVVRTGEEDMAYLDQFGPDSHWFADIQQFKKERSLGALQ